MKLNISGDKKMFNDPLAAALTKVLNAEACWEA